MTRRCGSRAADACTSPLMPPTFRYDWDRVAATITDRTRLIVINTPHNPACTAATAEDLDRLAEVIRGKNIFVLSDEVYEHVTYDGRKHVTVLAHPELRERSVAVFSFGKTLHATGLRVGYSVAPTDITRELRKVHQFNTFSIAHPIQEAIARYLDEKPEAWQRTVRILPGEARSRARGARGNRIRGAARRRARSSSSSSTPRFSTAPDVEFAERLLTEAGVATIPLSPF